MVSGKDSWSKLATTALCLLTISCGGGSGSKDTNQPPQISTTTVATDEDVTLNTAITAIDPEGTTLRFSKTADPEHGVLTLTDSGSITFVPTADFNGTDSFSVQVIDAAGSSINRTITIVVHPVNDAPVAHDDEIRLGTGAVSVPLLANDIDVDGDDLKVTIPSQPRGGVVSVAGSNTVTFTPENSYAGPVTFTYRVTDAAGITSDATARLVVGDFSPILMLADETTSGVRELHLYDGFRTTRVSSNLESDAAIQEFVIGPDGHHVTYVVASPNFSQLFLIDLATPGPASLLYTTSGPDQFNDLTAKLNNEASFALVRDTTLGSALRLAMVQTSNRVATTIGAMNLQIVQGADNFEWNPVTNEFYVQAQIGGMPRPMSGTGYRTLFAGTADSAAHLAQIGADYNANGGGGSGYEIKVTPDGRYVLHSSIAYGTPQPLATLDLLINDRQTNSERFVFRKFTPYEFSPPAFESVSADNTHICFVLKQATPPTYDGPSQV